MKLKEKFKRWLLKEEIERNEILFETARKKCVEMESRIKDVLGTIEVAVDVHEYNDSWAVICVNGKSDYVKFCNLGASDLREIQSFLKRFEYSKRIVDSAPHLRRYFKY